MNKSSGHDHTSRLTVLSTMIVVALVPAVAGCGGKPTSVGPPAATQSSPPSPMSQAGLTVLVVAVPKYVASENARNQVAVSTCRSDGAKGWLIKGTATNPTSLVRRYLIVVDFVTAKGSTVLDTKVVHVRSVAPRASSRWSAVGAAGDTHVACVIREALAPR